MSEQTPESAPPAPFTVGGLNLAAEDAPAEVSSSGGISLPSLGAQVADPPPASALKEEHVDFVAANTDLSAEEAAGLTKAELIDTEQQVVEAATQDAQPPSGS